MTGLRQTLYEIADELRGIASYINNFAPNFHYVERAHQIMTLAARLAAVAGDEPEEVVRTQFLHGSWQHFSPVIAVEAVVLNPQGELLLIQRSDSQQWALPGGIAEIGPTFPDAALRELWEEAGLRGRVTRLLGVFDGRLWQTESPWQLVYVIYQIECENLSPRPGIEAVGAGFFGREGLPPPQELHPGHEVRIRKCFELLDSGATHFDPAESFEADLPMHQRPPDEGGENTVQS